MEQAHQELVQQLKALSQRIPNLIGRLSPAVAKLKEDGTPLANHLIEELAAYRQEFANLRQKALAFGKSSSQQDVASLRDLETLIKSIIATDSQDGVREQALAVLNRVLTITHREQGDFAPLKSCQQKAQELHRAISSSPAGTLHPNAKAVADGKHPVSAVLTLVEQQENLEDDQWVTLEEEVAAAFGKQLAIAISRGKLTVPAAAPAVAATPNLDQISEVVIVPSLPTPAKTAKPDPDVVILESPAPSKPLHEVIIVPAVEVTQSAPNTGKTPVFIQPPAKAGTTSTVGLKLLTHIQNVGDRVFGAEEFAGSRGKALRLEAFQINIEPPVPGLSLRYMAHVSGIGDTPWLEEGQLAGARGQGRRVEGFAIELTGPAATNYDVFYMGHIQNVGDTAVLSNGQYCGTRGKNLRVEAMKVWIKAKN